MSSTEEPLRLVDDPRAGDALRDALEAGRAEAPSEAQLASLLAGLGPLIGPGGGGGGGGGPPVDPAGPSLVGTSAAVKGIAAMAVVAAVAAGGALVWSSSGEGPRSAANDARVERAEPVDPVPDASSAVPEGVDVPAELLAPEPAPDRPRDRRPERAADPATPTFEVDPAAEAALLRRAQAVLAADPSAALALTEEHAGRFGDGTLAQEREVVAIEALSRLGRDAAARRRASAFRTRWPRSAHGRRIDVILDEPR